MNIFDYINLRTAIHQKLHEESKKINHKLREDICSTKKSQEFVSKLFKELFKNQ